ncbi:hypothetical protein Tco_0698411 [Tanacetum coccineum]
MYVRYNHNLGSPFIQQASLQDSLNASSIRYALTVNPTIYTSCIKQFWATAKAKTVNGEVQIQALVDGKKVIVTETSVRRALQLKLLKVLNVFQMRQVLITADTSGVLRTLLGTNLVGTMALSCLSSVLANKPKILTFQGGFSEHYQWLNTHPLLFIIYITALEEATKEETEGKSLRISPMENTKTSQAAEITKLKERAKKLEMRNKSSTSGFKRLKKVGRTARIESSEDEGLGDQEDASKQGRKITNLDADAEVTLVDDA